jgi:hypothetical protein
MKGVAGGKPSHQPALRGSTRGMTAVKIAVSLPSETLERAKRAVRRGRAASVSAYVTAALDQKATLDELDDLLNEMLEESGGPMTSAEQRRTDELIVGPSPRSRKMTSDPNDLLRLDPKVRIIAV